MIWVIVDNQTGKVSETLLVFYKNKKIQISLISLFAEFVRFLFLTNSISNHLTEGITMIYNSPSTIVSANEPACRSGREIPAFSIAKKYMIDKFVLKDH